MAEDAEVISSWSRDMGQGQLYQLPMDTQNSRGLCLQMSFLSTQNDRRPIKHNPHHPKMLYPHKSLKQYYCKDECPHISARTSQAICWEREAGNTEGHSEIPGKAASVDQNNTVTMKTAHTASLHLSIHSASHTSKAAWLRGAGGECAWAGELQAECLVARAIIKGSAKP